MPEKWRILPWTEQEGALQMGTDEAMATAVGRGLVPPTLRFYGWKPSCVSIGYFQSLEREVDETRARDLGVDVVRRYTGGGAVFHEHEITYSLAAPVSRFPGDVLTSYRQILRGLIVALEQIGIQAGFSGLNDLTVGGRKISGSAQTRRTGILLQHGTLLLRVDPPRMFSLLQVPDEKIRDKMIQAVSERVTSMEQVLGLIPPRDQMLAALSRGFSQALGIDLEEGSLCPEEHAQARELMATKYGSPSWTGKR